MAWDNNLKLADNIDTAGTTRVNGTALDLNSLGYPGGLAQFRMWVGGAITGTSPTLEVRIEQSSDDSTYEVITQFPILGSAANPNADYASKASHVDCYAQVTKRYVRYSYIQTGTSPVYNDVSIYMRGIDAVGPA